MSFDADVEPPPSVDAGVEVDAGSPSFGPADTVFLDLVRHADRGHVRREGLIASPNTPGWTRITQLADSGPWQVIDRVKGEPAAWLEGVGGTLYFPVGREGHSLRRLLLRMIPIVRGQRVSIFVDEKSVGTIRVKSGVNDYDLPLPTKGLSPGEHSVRLWFRYARHRGKKGRKRRKRTPGALIQARLAPKGQIVEAPEVWVGGMEVGNEEGAALLAGPPAGWTFFFMCPQGARLRARLAVREGEPVDFIVRVSSDDILATEAERVTVQAETTTEIDVDLSAYGDRPIRVSLDTEGINSKLGQAGWITPRIMMPARMGPREAIPKVRNVVIWAVDGLRADRINLGRGGDRAHTPNIDMVARQGALALDVWSGGASASDGHRSVLWPAREGWTLPSLLGTNKVKTGLLSSSLAVPRELQVAFSTQLDLDRAGEPAETRILLRELNDWLDVRKKDRFFLYLASADPRAPLEPTEGYRQLYERARPLRGIEASRRGAKRRHELRIAYDAQLTASDYWLGQMMATLEVHGVLDETAIIIMGSVGQELREHGGVGDGHTLVPEILQVPVILWHPALRNRGRPRAPIYGAALGDLGATILTLFGMEIPKDWPGVDLSGALFERLPLPPHPSHARHRAQVAARYGGWLFRALGGRGLKLWNLAKDPEARDELSGENSIALRTVRDSMLDRP